MYRRWIDISEEQKEFEIRSWGNHYRYKHDVDLCELFSGLDKRHLIYSCPGLRPLMVIDMTNNKEISDVVKKGEEFGILKSDKSVLALELRAQILDLGGMCVEIQENLERWIHRKPLFLRCIYGIECKVRYNGR